MEIINEIFTIKNIALYLLLINIIGFLCMYIDKQKAKKNKWRISESTFLAITVLGGGIGTIAGMYTFRHKTKKPKFTILLPIILVIEIIVFIYYLLKM